MRHPMATTKHAWGAIACALLILATVLLVSPSVSASAVGSVAPVAASPSPEQSSTPSPPPSPEETESDKDRHQRQNGERPVERDDLGFLGILFVIGMGFVLVAGAVGVAFAGWKRRRRDRAAADAEGGA
ncbi:hypothetical protein [Microbacterium sp. HSID17254]|uniref:hypothetical protein n=1 Tax=Microbacterium sp. HSID17254 TaxID=2419509 RepID=UPI000F881CF1|nr:hypothetical protein [Microbacterium sp. HSID17254]